MRSAEREVTQSSDGKYRTAFCEDVYAMTSIHLRTIRERLTRQSEALVQAVILVFNILQEKQIKSRDNFCADFQSCCAAANDFLRMSDLCEEMIDEIKDECNLSSKATEILDEKSAALLGLYSSDAVHASKKTQSFCIPVIEEDIAEDIFGKEWEEELTDNELATAMVQTLDECMADVEKGLDDLMVNKAAEAQIPLAVNIYIKCLLVKGSKHNNGKNSMFSDNEEAIQRMRDDAQVLRSYFNEVAEDMPTLKNIVNEEFAFLDVFFDLLSIASGLSKSDVKESIMTIHKRLKNTMMTKFVIGDLWHVVNPSEEKNIYDTLDTMEESLNAIEQQAETTTNISTERSSVADLQFENVVKQYIEADSRKRPMKSEGAKKAEAALRGWGFLGQKKGEETPKKDSGKTDTDESEEDENDSDNDEDDE
jgi:flagellar motor component MotA